MPSLPLRKPNTAEYSTTLRVYVDTSVIGGCFDDEFQEASERLLDHARSGRVKLLVSYLAVKELRRAPPHVQDLFDQLPPESIENVEESHKAEELAEAYIKQGAIGRRTSQTPRTSLWPHCPMRMCLQAGTSSTS